MIPQNTTHAKSITAVHPDIIESQILTRLDGPTLAYSSCVSSEFNTLCSNDNLWKDICNISWPSTLDPLLHNQISSHRRFFSDVSSAVHNLNLRSSQPTSSKIKRLISAVDIDYEGIAMCSKVILTDSSSSWFSLSPCVIDLLEQKELVPTYVKLSGGDECLKELEKSLKVSWILIDPDTKRALNVSSKTPVLVRRHLLTREFQVSYATVVPDCRQFGSLLVQCGVVVTCRLNEKGEMHVKEVTMTMEDLEGLILNGSEGLQVLQEVMTNGERKKIDSVDEKERYDMFVTLNTGSSDVKQRREPWLDLDMFCVFTGDSIACLKFVVRVRVLRTPYREAVLLWEIRYFYILSTYGKEIVYARLGQYIDFVQFWFEF